MNRHLTGVMAAVLAAAVVLTAPPASADAGLRPGLGLAHQWGRLGGVLGAGGAG